MLEQPKLPPIIASPTAAIPSLARAILSINLTALRANYRKLAQMSAPASCAGVIKADAYGLGMATIAKALWQEGCRTFFIATLGEARNLRLLQPNATIYALDGIMPETSSAMAEIGVRPVLSSLDEIAEWAQFCQQVGICHPAAIHIDTGMNRLGLSPSDVAVLANQRDILANFDLDLVMSHLVSGDERGAPRTQKQSHLFNELRALLPKAPASLANSAGTQLGGSLLLDITRPGIAIYGGHVFADAPNPMLPVVCLQARILQLRDIKPGETVGYNETFRAERAMHIATLATGYADGFMRRQSATNDDPGLPVYIGGYAAPLLGRVSMDYIGVDVSHIPRQFVRRGDMADIIGDQVTVNDIAKRAGTSCYEVLTQLSPRAERTYIGA